MLNSVCPSLFSSDPTAIIMSLAIAIGSTEYLYDHNIERDIPVVIDMLSNQIHTTRSADVEIGTAAVLLLEQNVQFLEAGSNRRDIVIHVVDARE